jgi:nucleotide-binding universal stress UspA family protein
MRRFREILVVAGTDAETPQLIQRAAELADRNQARLTIFDVVPRLPRNRRAGTTADSIDLQSLLVEARRNDLEEMAARIMTIPTRVAVAEGIRFIEIIERVVKYDHDLVIMLPDRTRESRGLRGATTTMHMLRKCPCPVWVDDPEAWDRRDVVVAVGPFETGEDGLELQRTLVELGTSLAAIQGGEAHLVHAWRLEGENLFRNGRVSLAKDEVDALLAEERVAAEAGFEELAGEYRERGLAFHSHLHKGDPADVISKVVADVTPGVVVMGTLARAGLKGLIIGNTAERLLDSIEGSVLAVKPPGFVSPVTGV